jgi:hypothetical protein
MLALDMKMSRYNFRCSIGLLSVQSVKPIAAVRLTAK